MTAPAIRNNSRITILATLALLFFFGQAHAASRMPAFTLPDAVNGTPINSSSLQDNVILINFFTTL